MPFWQPLFFFNLAVYALFIREAILCMGLILAAALVARALTVEDRLRILGMAARKDADGSRDLWGRERIALSKQNDTTKKSTDYPFH